MGTLSKFDNDPSSSHIGIQKLFTLMNFLKLDQEKSQNLS